MRKVDIENSRDFYKKTLKTALQCMTNMARVFEEAEEHYQKRIKDLENRNEQNTNT